MVAASETTIQRILEGHKQYVVPLYQRPYQWKASQLSALWEDIAELSEARRHDASATHFIGSLVLAPAPAGVAGGVTQYLVVDGQQRLTTLTLLLAAIRDHLRDGEPADTRDIDRIHNHLLINQYETELFRYKLLPTQADRSSYEAVVDEKPTAGGKDTIGLAYRYFRGRLAALELGDRKNVVEIAATVTTGLALVSISTHPSDNVHRIFESLNNTGLKLTQGDLLRNYLFMRLPNRSDEVYRKYWIPLQETLSNDEIELLFWNDLVHHNPTAKISDTFSGQQRRLEQIESEDTIVDEVARLEKLGRLFRLIRRPEEETNPEVKRRLQRLAQWQSTTPGPLILKLLALRDSGNASSAEVAKALLYVESYLVRRVIIGRASQGLNRIFSQAVQELSASNPVDDAVAKYLSEGRKHFATDDQIRSAVESVPFYLNGRAIHRKLILTWLEETYGAKEVVDMTSLNIEHIMPQTLSPEWLTYITESSASDAHSEHVALVHTLGNLTLTGYNPEMGNRAFEMKRPHYASSGILMNHEIANYSKWTPNEIRLRSALIAERIIGAWPSPIRLLKDEPALDMTQELVATVLAEIPSGSWTTYGDLAALLGTSSTLLRSNLPAHARSQAHRVLADDGRLLSSGQNGADQLQLRSLELEGVLFDSDGIANPCQRLSVEDLAGLTPGGWVTESD